MRVALDFHGVLADLIGPVAQHLNREKALQLTHEDFDRWDAWGNGFTKNDFFDAINACDNASLPPLPGALSGLRVLHRHADVSIVSGTRDPNGIVRWLRHHGMPELPVYGVCAPKTEHAKLALGFDAYVDDNPGMVDYAPDVPRVVLYDQPWNRRTVFSYPRVQRATSWPPGHRDSRGAGRMKLTAKNADAVLAKLAALIKKDPDMLASLDGWLDEMLEQDAFGTEGQLDPRGDRRE